MNFLLDTNIVSEWTKLRPDERVAAWLAQQDEDRIFISVVTLAELRRGVERLPAGARAKKVQLLVSGRTPKVQEANGVIQLTIDSILDHEVVAIDL